ncbi:MAG: hypothetical protein HYY15_02940 [Candidatus Omnitrophica bacterium]|nr:hypothetical protein [Candidatus Omnitrophota bacterium]
MRQRKSWVRWIVPVVGLGTIAYAIAEDLTLTTYYPSPRGVYKEVRVTDRLAVGTTTPTAQVEVVAPAPATAITTDQTTLQVSVPATTRFNTADQSLTNAAASITNQAVNSSTNNALTNVGLTVSASGAERNYGLLVPQGQVGIGTTAPTTLLHLRGSANSLRIEDGTEGTGKVLTSDAQGVARWAASSGTTWRRIASTTVEFADTRGIATADLPTTCTTPLSSCEGMIIQTFPSGISRGTSFIYLVTGLYDGAGAYYYLWSSMTNKGGYAAGANGEGTATEIANAGGGLDCAVYDDQSPWPNNEMSPSKWTITDNYDQGACELWVSGF